MPTKNTIGKMERIISSVRRGICDSRQIDAEPTHKISSSVARPGLHPSACGLTRLPNSLSAKILRRVGLEIISDAALLRIAVMQQDAITQRKGLASRQHV